MMTFEDYLKRHHCNTVSGFVQDLQNEYAAVRAQRGDLADTPYTAELFRQRAFELAKAKAVEIQEFCIKALEKFSWYDKEKLRSEGVKFLNELANSLGSQVANEIGRAYERVGTARKEREKVKQQCRPHAIGIFRGAVVAFEAEVDLLIAKEENKETKSIPKVYRALFQEISDSASKYAESMASDETPTRGNLSPAWNWPFIFDDKIKYAVEYLQMYMLTDFTKEFKAAYDIVEARAKSLEHLDPKAPYDEGCQDNEYGLTYQLLVQDMRNFAQTCHHIAYNLELQHHDKGAQTVQFVPIPVTPAINVNPEAIRKEHSEAWEKVRQQISVGEQCKQQCETAQDAQGPAGTTALAEFLKWDAANKVLIAGCALIAHLSNTYPASSNSDPLPGQYDARLAVLRQIQTHLDKERNQIEESQKNNALKPSGQLENPENSGGKKTIKEPSKEAIAAFRCSFFMGYKQAEIARELTERFGRVFSQPTVSKMITKVRKYVDAGNVLPDLPEAHPDVKTVDPAMLDMGQRQDGRSVHQRGRSDLE